MDLAVDQEFAKLVESVSPSTHVATVADDPVLPSQEGLFDYKQDRQITILTPSPSLQSVTAQPLSSSPRDPTVNPSSTVTLSPDSPTPKRLRLHTTTLSTFCLLAWKTD